MQTVVCDSSVLIHLANIRRLYLLKDFYEKILIPPAVWREVVEEGKEKDEVKLVKEAYSSGWTVIEAPANKPLVKLLERYLHPEEAETIALAVEESALILIDESEGRRIADIYGLQKTGIIGILIMAKLKKKISSIQKELDKLRYKGGFWISDEIYKKALKYVGEQKS